MGFNNKYNRTFGLLLVVIALFLVTGCADASLKLGIRAPTVTLAIQNYCPVSNFTYHDVFAYNASASMTAGGWVTDTDRDGLPDYVEKDAATISSLAINYKFGDTNGDFYSDL